MFRFLPSLVLCLGGLVTASIARGQAPSTTTVSSDRSASFARPGDVLRLRIWREPDFSGDFVVNHHGDVVLPRLGETPVSSVDPDSLAPRLVRAYTEYLNNPTIEIVLLRRISVLGAVRTPGLYPVDPTMRISDVLALAGGTAPDGKQGRLELRRDGVRIDTDLMQTARIAELPIRSGDQLFVPQRGWLSRNTWLISTVVGATATLLIAVTR